MYFSPFHSVEISVCACAKSLQSCLTFCDTMDCSPPGSSLHEILHTRTQKLAVMPSSRGSSHPRGQTFLCCSACVARRFLTANSPEKPICVCVCVCVCVYVYSQMFMYIHIYTQLYIYISVIVWCIIRNIYLVFLQTLQSSKKPQNFLRRSCCYLLLC